VNCAKAPYRRDMGEMGGNAPTQQMTHSVTYCCVGGRGAGGAEIEGDPIPLLFLQEGFEKPKGKRKKGAGQSEKYLDLSDFSTKNIMLLKGNTYVSLTKESLAEIKRIKSGMNKGRKIKNLLSVSISARPFLPVGPGERNKRHYSTTINKADQTYFNQRLAGLIDGDGQFHTTKKDISSLKIVMNMSDKSLLYSIKHKYGGFVKEIAGSNALKYKLTNPKGLINLVNDINGLIRNPIRMLQLNRICVKYNVKLIAPQPLTYNDG